ncbi:hypothetical protein TD95_003222 [Thielaviopsis punctulata]|uniref:Major facilitator superfamily (MFS) profile domain-containing protein n=1 Tax=Thielaviopsis punctulata TaxID=72032 RepID=A0A0F4ZDA5_9PEZI|nr:hypothetical protein TD95_003222 [Thielaviopsis punctulata]
MADSKQDMNLGLDIKTTGLPSAPAQNQSHVSLNTAWSPATYKPTADSPASPALGIDKISASEIQLTKVEQAQASGESTQSELQSKIPTTPPDGGLKAWLQVLGAWCIYFNTWGMLFYPPISISDTSTSSASSNTLPGILSSFGAFQSYYNSSLLTTNTAFQISIIGSLQSFLTVFLGFIAGPIYDLGYATHLLYGGSFLVITGTVTQSLCKNLWQLLITQGVCIGVGAGCLSVLPVAIPSMWFSRRLPIANGIAATGSGVGGLVIPALFRAIQPDVGFRNAVLIIGLMNMTTLAVTLFVLATPKTVKARRAFIDKSAFTDVPYLCFLFACFMVFLGMYTPFTYVQSFSHDEHLANGKLGMYLLSILNGASIVGRIVPNFFSNRIGPMNMQIGATLVLAIAAFCLTAVNSLSSLLVVVIIYGFASGTFFAIQPTIYTRLVADKKYLGTRFGMAFSVMSFALLFGPPIAGALMRMSDYNAAWVWTGSVVSAGAGLIVVSRGFAHGWGPGKI